MKKAHQLKSPENSIQAAANSSSVKNNSTVQLQDNRPKSVIQRAANTTGLPDDLKTGVESLSGHSMNDVKVHYNSSRPAQLQAHAYAQGTDIHIAPGQEKHLPHEVWHVVQQKQGRVKPTLQMKGKVNINDDKGLEKEADVMGAKALQMKATHPIKATAGVGFSNIVQRYLIVGPTDYTRRFKAPPGENIDTLTNEVFNGILAALNTMDPYELTVHTFLHANAGGKVKGQIKKWIEDNPGAGPPHSSNVDFGRKRQDRSYAGMYQLAMAIYGWVSSKPGRKNEKRMADDVYANPEMDVHMDNIFNKLKTWIRTGPHGLAKAADIEAELDAEGMPTAHSWDDYRQYFNHPPKGAIPTVPNNLWAVIDNPQGFDLRAKISTFHDVMKYFMNGSGTQGNNMLAAPPVLNATTSGGRVGYARPEMSRVVKTGVPGLANANLLNARAGLNPTVKNSAEEDHDTFTFARLNKIPMWGRHSFTAARMMTLTQQIGGDHKEISATAWAIFAFWRKHYDHRSIPYHTLHEIMDFTPAFGLAYNPLDREAGLKANHNVEGDLLAAISAITNLADWSAKKKHWFRRKPKGVGMIHDEIGTGHTNIAKLTRIRAIANGRPAVDADRDIKTTEFYDLMKDIPGNLSTVNLVEKKQNKTTLLDLVRRVRAFTL